MRLLRPFSPFAIVFVALFAFPVAFYPANDRSPNVDLREHLWFDGFANFVLYGGYADYTESYPTDYSTIVPTPTDGGIRLDVPDKYKERFDRWKDELLSTEFGRNQWDTYANNKGFILTIKITGDKGKGAGTDSYLWDDTGKFVGATITLGDDIDRGYPNPIYYPVMNSLSPEDTTYSISGKILAAAKMSHEFGHVNQTAAANQKFLLLQNKLMPEYTSIFLKNGRNINDKKLVDLASQMGGTPVEIWESREYWSEINAMRYVNDRISKENFYCYVFNKMKRNIEEYAKNYEQRFDQYSEFAQSPCFK
jgi:hypothetical protein